MSQNQKTATMTYLTRAARAQIEAMADQECRSLSAQIEYMLIDWLRKERPGFRDPADEDRAA